LERWHFSPSLTLHVRVGHRIRVMVSFLRSTANSSARMSSPFSPIPVKTLNINLLPCVFFIRILDVSTIRGVDYYTPENTAVHYRRHCGYKPIFILQTPTFTFPYMSTVVPAASRAGEKSTFRGSMTLAWFLTGVQHSGSSGSIPLPRWGYNCLQ